MTISINNERYGVLESLGFSSKLNAYVAITFSTPWVSGKHWNGKTSIAIKPVGEKQWSWFRDRLPKVEHGDTEEAVVL